MLDVNVVSDKLSVVFLVRGRQLCDDGCSRFCAGIFSQHSRNNLRGENNQLKIWALGCHHSTVDSSAPSILHPQVRVSAYHLSFYIFVIVSCGMDENKRKRGRDWPIKKSEHWSLKDCRVFYEPINALFTLRKSKGVKKLSNSSLTCQLKSLRKTHLRQ